MGQKVDSSEIVEFLSKLQTIWKENIYNNYQDLKILYENDLYALLYHYLTPFILKQPDWRILVNYGDCDFVMVKYKEKKILATIREKTPNLRELHPRHRRSPYTIKFIPEVGHWVQQEAPDRVNTYILDFLEK